MALDEEQMDRIFRDAAERVAGWGKRDSTWWTLQAAYFAADAIVANAEGDEEAAMYNGAIHTMCARMAEGGERKQEGEAILESYEQGDDDE
jgi:hypothetical protein